VLQGDSQVHCLPRSLLPDLHSVNRRSTRREVGSGTPLIPCTGSARFGDSGCESTVIALYRTVHWHAVCFNRAKWMGESRWMSGGAPLSTCAARGQVTCTCGGAARGLRCGSSLRSSPSGYGRRWDGDTSRLDRKVAPRLSFISLLALLVSGPMRLALAIPNGDLRVPPASDQPPNSMRATGVTGLAAPTITAQRPWWLYGWVSPQS